MMLMNSYRPLPKELIEAFNRELQESKERLIQHLKAPSICRQVPKPQTSQTPEAR